MSFIYKNFAQVLNQYNYSFHAGDIIVGTIFSKETTGYLVDIGHQTGGYLPLEEIILTETNTSCQDLELNTTREFFILTYNIESQQLVVSIKRLTYIRAWDRIKQLKQENITIQAYVRSINKGGVLVEIEEIQGFIPNSHLPYKPSKKHFLYTNITCKLLVVHEQNNTLICSVRCAIVSQLMNKLKVGSILNSQVIGVTEFGVFFNIYNIPALLHKSELKEEYISTFHIGTTWSIQIIHIDTRQGRISVSLA
uniref:Ribosomal protein S1 n=1 Tax=Trichogloeopsis pedicellata TaxID=1495610 RepID=A0A1G4P0V5_9FLOR|nr:Ribosomal protein S1 [Trichogloeopsis pedicellata]SCW24499.1 Ribosomal protein S1 [Trichogloeopsis pedicellata]